MGHGMTRRQYGSGSGYDRGVNSMGQGMTER